MRIKATKLLEFLSRCTLCMQFSSPNQRVHVLIQQEFYGRQGHCMNTPVHTQVVKIESERLFKGSRLTGSSLSKLTMSKLQHETWKSVKQFWLIFNCFLRFKICQPPVVCLHFSFTECKSLALMHQFPLIRGEVYIKSSCNDRGL